MFAIETSALTRSYGDVTAVRDLSLEVTCGSVYAFLGPNGAGKTTTIRMLLGLARPHRGEIRIMGMTLEGRSRRAILARVGAMVETPSLYPHLTGYENLQVAQELADRDRTGIAYVLRVVRLHQDAHRLVKTYSQGMRQRLGIALALLGEPELLVLDEPTNGLDPAGIQEIRALIRGLAAERGITVFLSSHLLAEVEQVASHVGIIGRGQLLFQGPLAGLRGRQHVVVEVDRPSAAASIIRQAGWAIRSIDGPGLMVDLANREEVARAAGALVGAGVRLYQLRTTQPSLEDLFLDLTSGAHLASPTGAEVHP